MAHQSGIRVSEALSAAFVDALENSSVRAIKVGIVSESLEPTNVLEIQGSFEQDLTLITSLLQDEEPCYLLVRLDSTDATAQALSDKWLFATFVPDNAKVRDKMLYASTKATVTKMLGESYFVDSMYGTTKDEFSLDGYRQHRKHAESSAPLTERELEMERVKEIESAAADAPTMNSRRSHVSSATFPLDDEAESALAEYAKGTINFVLLALDIAAERVVLDHKDSLQSHDDVASSFPTDAPRYAFYWYNSSTSLFVYFCPTTSSIRERMIYSSFRHGLIVTSKNLGVNATIKLEVDTPTELSATALDDEVTSRVPATTTTTGASAVRAPPTQTKFRRPAPPGRRPRTTPAANSQ
ncbi:Twinfilin-1 [Dipsacomyces acuminosporus]|nr:Twinfilin-1 [Dipsacomyces acuminosporus]